MKLKITSLAIASALFGAVAMPAQAADSTTVPAWVNNLKFNGDFRARYENDTSNYKNTHDKDGVTHDRLRIRARFGLAAKINKDVKVGFRFASGSVNNYDGTSTNQTLGQSWDDKSFDLDRAYLDWSPSAIGGDSHFVFGKMPQQWQAVTHMVWDDDLNPEGVAYKGKYNLGGFDLVPSAGYYVLGDRIGGNNDSVSADWHVTWAQIATQVAGANIGVSYFGYDGNNENNYMYGSKKTAAYSPEIYQGFASYKFNVGMPLALYGTYAHNNADYAKKDGADYKHNPNAYAVGIKTKFDKFKIGYEYRNNGTTAIQYNFNDSDFGDRRKGHVIKASYSIAKNFDLAAAYMNQKSNTKTSNDRQLFQLDLKAKF